jgi:hypothetical protein
MLINTKIEFISIHNTNLKKCLISLVLDRMLIYVIVTIYGELEE